MNNALYNQIRIFQSIAREGNISAAARKLEITPPSVSNALRLLGTLRRAGPGGRPVY